MEYLIQNKSKYQRIKKIHQVLEMITRIDEKIKSLCLVITGFIIYKIYTTYQFTYSIDVFKHDVTKDPKNHVNMVSTSKDTYKIRL